MCTMSRAAFFNLKGRGTGSEPGNRFEKWHIDWDAGMLEEMELSDPDHVRPLPRTQIIRDDTRSLITSNRSPDIGFDASLNPYRGCEHGCAYCYARPYHEYLGFNAGLDFETRIMVKPEAPALLEAELSSRSWRPQVLACSGVTDAYQPVERHLKITRGCLEVLERCRHPVAIITKNALVIRDLDLLSSLASHQAAAVAVSVTTLDAGLAGLLEPRASRPEARLRAISELAAAGVPVGVSIAPIIPGLNDHEIPAIAEAAAAAGAKFAFSTLVRLPYGVKDIFSDWLERHRPGEAKKILDRIREARAGKLNEAGFGSRMRGTGAVAEGIQQLFRVSTQRAGLNRADFQFCLSIAAFRRPSGGQLEFEFL